MKSKTQSAIKIDVWSDVACPWCYIGKRRLEAGVGLFEGTGKGRSVEVEYHSYELSPDTPVDFEGTASDFLVSHKGMSADQVEQMWGRVVETAKGVGLDYDLASVQHTNTVKAHQLLHYAKARELQAEMKERLLRAFFIEGRHVGHVDDLADLATELGLDRMDVIRSLNEEEFLDAVRADQSLAVEYGIQGVPFYVVDGKYGVSGAQEAATFNEVLEQVWNERAGENE